MEATQADSVVRSPDLRREQRWPKFVAEAIELGVFSTLSFQLYTHHRGSGALNLLSKQVNAFDLKAETTLAMLASRDVIGQAKGIIMERYKLDASRAFAMLVKLS